MQDIYTETVQNITRLIELVPNYETDRGNTFSEFQRSLRRFQCTCAIEPGISRKRASELRQVAEYAVGSSDELLMGCEMLASKRRIELMEKEKS